MTITILPTAINDTNDILPESFKAEKAERAINPHTSIEEWDGFIEQSSVALSVAMKARQNIDRLTAERNACTCPEQRVFLHEMICASKSIFDRYISTSDALLSAHQAEKES